MRGVPGLHDGGVVEGVDEVGVVRQPTPPKYKGHSTKHFHNLKVKVIFLKGNCARERKIRRVIVDIKLDFPHIFYCICMFHLNAKCSAMSAACPPYTWCRNWLQL